MWRTSREGEGMGGREAGREGGQWTVTTREADKMVEKRYKAVNEGMDGGRKGRREKR